jgi:hypothetical protein
MRWSTKLRTPGRIRSLRRFNFGVGRLKDNKAIASMFPEEMLTDRELHDNPRHLSATADAVARPIQKHRLVATIIALNYRV